ncbi:MAG: SIMPL domain-containing protein [Alistipes sp.]|nr:SIMPL domain-containing protein [Alistipes sp.]
MEKTGKPVAAAAVLAVGIIVAGWLLYRGVVHFKDSDRVVSVKGLSEKEVKADRAIWPLVYKLAGNDVTSLYNTIESTNAKIVSFLVSNGIAKEEITVSPAEVIDMDAERYVSQGVKYRFNVTSVLTVSTDKVDLVVDLMSRQGDLLRQGIAVGSGDDYRYRTQFLYTSESLNEIKPVMIEEATRNARVAAEKFARDSESRLGKIKRANQGQFSISDRDANTPYIKTVRVVTSVDYLLKD